MLTCELQNWSGQTCLGLAVAANHRPLIAHPCSQIILADLWMGGLRTRKNTNMKVSRKNKNLITFHHENFILCCQVFLGLVFPPYISRLEFKSKDELQQMPQTEEDHITGKVGKDTVPNGTETADTNKASSNEQDVEVSADFYQTGSELLYMAWWWRVLVNMF
jgi:transient receptor potential cation channel subfamily M member 3